MKYFSLGDFALDTIIEELENAKEFIFIEFFMVEEGIFFNQILSVLERKVKEGVEVASFSKWGENQLNVNFNGVDVMEMCSILTEVNSFYNNVVEKVEDEPINI